MVLKRLLFRNSEPERCAHSVPDGVRVYAVGDIHGRLDLLNELLERIEQDERERGGAETQFVFLGDLVDRGPESCGVVERLLQFQQSGRNVRFLIGNHEEVFLRAAGGDPKATRFLVKIGGRETILSYGISEQDYGNCDFDELTELLGRKVPPAHLEFLRSFEDVVEIGDYLFVHAGIRPGVAIEEQSAADLRWIRGEFLTHRDMHCRMIVHGHTITDEVDLRKNRIGIDTGAYASGRLTAIGLEANRRWFVATGEAAVRQERRLRL